jgi:TRAP-type C4-dicarboxylate transport system permease small subunit
MKYTWWIFQVLMTLVSGFFLLFGIDLIIGSYSLKDPFSFIMTFFAASFIILISLTLMISFLIKMIRVYRHINHQTKNSR